MADLLDGKGLALKVREGLALQVQELTEKLGRPPGLSVILVGDDSASAIYVRNKEKAASTMGLKSEIIRLPAQSSEADILAEIEKLNQDETVDGFMVQFPLPQGIDQTKITLAIAPEKDADGLHPTNLGKLLAGVDAPRPCTPSAVIKILEEGGVEFEGKRAVVVGRSILVGKPLALLLLEKNATVTVCHSRTADLAEEVSRADIVVAAMGRPRFISGDWIKPGAAVVDVGINLVDGKLCGDVDFEAAEKIAGCITPVPGGVGPMTVAMLMKNAVDAAARKLP